jgi:hypothetical protein
MVERSIAWIVRNGHRRSGSAASMTSSLMRHAMPVSVRRQPESGSSAAYWRATRYAIAFYLILYRFFAKRL